VLFLRGADWLNYGWREGGETVEEELEGVLFGGGPPV